MKILLTGSSGLLGKELLKINPNIIALTHDECNIKNAHDVRYAIKTHRPDVVIHAAAMTDNRLVEKDPFNAIFTNIIGTANVAMVCIDYNVRMVYLSTDYVYAGERGNFSEQEPLKPFNLYAWTKLGGECSVVGVENHLIIRTSFGGDFQYKQAFTDKYSSKDYVDRLAPQIYEAALSPLTGVLNLGTERKTLFDHAKERNPDVIPVKLSETNFFTPVDTSLNLQRWIDYKGSKSIARPHTNCRICDSSRLVKYLDLGLMPLANNLAHTAQEAKSQDRFPLQVMMCEDCGLSQLSVVIDPEKMFSNYAYRSSVNKPYVEHCRQMAKDLQREYNLGTESFHVDIAGNDGSLLKEFREEIGLRVLNVDPASNLVAICEAQGIPAVADFWGVEVAENIEKKYGRADLITATNVFAHLDGVKEFMVAAKGLLKKSGVLVIECPYLIDFIENMEYPTLYFEHISTMSVMPMYQLCKDNGLKIIEVQKFPIHCGTIRVTIAHDTSNHQVGPSVPHFMAKELAGGYQKKETYKDWEGKVKAQVHEFEMKLLDLKKSGAKIAAIGGSAKGNTLLNYAKMNTDIISYIMDDTSEKIGKFSPGTGIPVVHRQHLLKDMPDYVIVLAWNFADVLIAKLKDMGYTGKFIIPIPKFTIID